MKSIHIHSFFRAGSTWFWNKFRELPTTYCYYEPFNEIKIRLSKELIGTAGSSSWNSNHPALDAPNDAEFLPLLQNDCGVKHFDQKFSYNAYYTSMEKHQKKYLNYLEKYAETNGKIAVFGNVRTLGRLEHLKKNLGGTHIVLFRNPLDKFLSFEKQAANNDVFYFLVRFYQIACIANQYYPAFFEEFNLPYGDGTIENHEVELKNFKNYYLDTNRVERFRLFLRLYCLDLLLSMPHADLIVDIDKMMHENYRSNIRSQIVELTGLELNLDDCNVQSHPDNDIGYYNELNNICLFLQQIDSPVTNFLIDKIKDTINQKFVIPLIQVEQEGA